MAANTTFISDPIQKQTSKHSWWHPQLDIFKHDKTLIPFFSHQVLSPTPPNLFVQEYVLDATSLMRKETPRLVNKESHPHLGCYRHRWVCSWERYSAHAFRWKWVEYANSLDNSSLSNHNSSTWALNIKVSNLFLHPGNFFQFGRFFKRPNIGTVRVAIRYRFSHNTPLKETKSARIKMTTNCWLPNVKLEPKS